MNNKNLIKAGRAVGNSTRLADYYIQELFEKGTVEIRDHCRSTKTDILLFDKIMKRLHLEHPSFFSNMVEVNRKSCTLKLKEDKKYPIKITEKPSSAITYYTYTISFSINKSKRTGDGCFIIQYENQERIIQNPRLQFTSTEQLSLEQVYEKVKGTVGITEITGSFKDINYV